jgi:hypothetical protein
MITIDRKSRSRCTGNDDHLGLEIAITFSRNAHWVTCAENRATLRLHKGEIKAKARINQPDRKKRS